jgi:uncharacterized membrane protein
MSLKNISKRHLLKSFSWRLLASLDTFVLSYIISSDLFFGASISFLEIISKTTLYYFHERIWVKSKIKKANIRHFIKPFTWRIVGTIDTILISTYIYSNYKMGIELGVYEIFTKIILFYLHDKIWYKSKFGVNEK